MIMVAPLFQVLNKALSLECKPPLVHLQLLNEWVKVELEGVLLVPHWERLLVDLRDIQVWR
jgi:hypothetical protein